MQLPAAPPHAHVAGHDHASASASASGGGGGGHCQGDPEGCQGGRSSQGCEGGLTLGVLNEWRRCGMQGARGGANTWGKSKVHGNVPDVFPGTPDAVPFRPLIAPRRSVLAPLHEVELAEVGLAERSFFQLAEQDFRVLFQFCLGVRGPGGGPGASRWRMGAGEDPARGPQHGNSGDTAPVPPFGLWSAPSRVEAQGG